MYDILEMSCDETRSDEMMFVYVCLVSMKYAFHGWSCCCHASFAPCGHLVLVEVVTEDCIIFD